MGKQTGILPFTGKLGNLIGYRRNGTYFIRSMPETVRQTAATRQSARDFGMASRKGKLIRRAIAAHASIRHDSSLVNRLNKSLIHARDQLQTLKGFRLNRHTGIENFFCQQPFLAPDGTLQIPAQILPPQGAATRLEIKVIATRISFTEQRVTHSSTSTVMMEIGTPSNSISLNIHTAGKGTLLVVLAVKAYAGEIAMEDRRFTTADIILVASPTNKKQKANRIPEIRKVLPYTKPVNSVEMSSREIDNAVEATQRE